MGQLIGTMGRIDRKEQDLMSTFKQIPSQPVASRLAVCAALALALLAVSPMLAQSGGGNHWVGTWTTSLVGRPQSPLPPAPAAPNAASVPGQAPLPAANPQPAIPAPFIQFNNQTLRQIVHTSIGGARTRVVLSNSFGTAALTIGAAHIGLRDHDASIVTGSDRVLNFGGRPTVTIPPGAVIYSDPVNLDVPPMGDVAIDLYLPGDTNTPSPLTMHNASFQTSYVSETGNHAGIAALPVVAQIQSWFLLSRLEVVAPDSVGAVVTFGDSITDGTRSTPDTNSRWPDRFARRLLSQAGGPKLGVLDAGIAGNRVLSNGAFGVGVDALARFDADALSQPGVTHIIVLEAINDIGQARQSPTPTAEDLIVGHQQLIERAHGRGIRIYGATLTPFEAAAYFTKEGEAKRSAVNQWIRTSGAYDAVIDFDAATRDPANPTRFLPQYDSGDHLHPNDAGYQAMANAIDLALFKSGAGMKTSTR
jgi:lysophospholipase L1-like esterase